MEKYKVKFKYYKRKYPPPDLSEVIDVRKQTDKNFSTRNICNVEDAPFMENKYGLKPSSSWKVYEFLHNRGLMFIENPFTAVGQRYWCCRCLRDYTRKPQKLNIDAHDHLEKDENWWDVCMRGGPRSQMLLKKLRWSTLGYHHNWDTKIYSESEHNIFPRDLSELTQFIAQVLGFEDFVAEAAIVNFYHMDSTLSGHTDVSEAFREAPLFSFSFGQSAIFLLGGETLAEDPFPLLLCSGDIVVMSGRSRLCYHGVPRILPATISPWSHIPENESLITSNKNYNAVISEEFDHDEGRTVKKLKKDSTCSDEIKNKSDTNIIKIENVVTDILDFDPVLFKKCYNDSFWKDFGIYLENSRINVNIRQVLRPGQKSLLQ